MEMNVSPTLIDVHGFKFFVYSAPKRNDGPCLYFYDLENDITICRIRGAEIFIDSYEDSESGTTTLSYIQGNKIIQREVDF